MANNFTVSTVFSAIDHMSGPLDRMMARVNGFGQRVNGAMGAIGRTARTAAIGIGAAGAAVGYLAKGFLDAGAEVERYKTSLQVMLGSQEAANARFEEMSRFAASTPFELTEVVELGNQLQALGRYSIDNMTLLGDLASAAGKPIDQVSRAFAKLASGQKGVAVDMFRDLLITTDDWVVATGKGVSASGELLATTEEMMAVLPRILESKGFDGMMAQQARTFNGKVSNMKDSIFQLQAAFGAAMVDPAGGAVERISAFINNITSKVTANADAVGRFFGQFFDVASGVLTSVFNLAGQLAPVFQKVFSSAMRVMEVIGPVLTNAISQLTPAIIAIVDAIAPFVEGIIPVISQFFEMAAPIATQLVRTLMPVLQTVGRVVAMLAGKFLTVLEPVLVQVMEAIEILAPVIQDLVVSFSDVLGPAIEAMLPIVVALSPLLVDLANGFKFIADVIKPLVDLLGFATKAGHGPGVLGGLTTINTLATAGEQGLSPMDAILKQQLEAALSNKFMGLGDALRNNMLNNPAFADQRREAERLGIPLTTETTTNRTTVDVNFSGAPAGTTVRQTGAAPGVRLNTGPNRGAR